MHYLNPVQDTSSCSTSTNILKSKKDLKFLNSLQGRCQEISKLEFFFRNQPSPSPNDPSSAISKNREETRNLRLITGVGDQLTDGANRSTLGC
jgi:hypothetical protein